MLDKFFIYRRRKIRAHFQIFQFRKPIYFYMWWSGEILPTRAICMKNTDAIDR